MSTVSTMGVREMKAQEVMHQGCVTIKSQATISEALEKMRQAKVSCLVVEPRRPGDAYGIVTRQDLLEKAVVPGPRRFNFSEHRVYEVMNKPLITISPGLKVKYAARLLSRNHMRRLPVFDGEKIVGILGDTDIFNKL
ncbi:MAG: CBS domain-containing protein [Elusimicrobia bacterium]|nr:CBS domain-containing protein [Elusimicrobiota bacterium]